MPQVLTCRPAMGYKMARFLVKLSLGIIMRTVR